jgi:hypothetical protein
MVKKTPEKVMDVNVQLAHGKFRMDDAFELRVKAIDLGKTSEVLWASLSDEYKEVLAQIFKRSLEVLHANTDRFLPNIISGDPGDLIEITCQVLFASIEEQADIRQEANDFERQAAKDQMIAELLEDTTPLSDEEFLDNVKTYLDYGVNVPNPAVQRLVEMAASTND